MKKKHQLKPLAAHLPVGETWILVANRSQARIFRYLGLRSGLELIEKIEHPESKRPSRDFISDRPGRVFDSMGSGRHSLSTELEAHDRQALEFARDLAEKLRASRGRNEFSRLMLVAEARFLGMLKGALDEQTRKALVATLDRDFHQKSSSQLSRHVEQYLVQG
jgi:protein required for attachment to host cells